MTIFISRELAADSPFFSLLPQDKVRIICESLIDFTAIDFSTLPEVDWCFFSSRHAVQFFFQGLKKSGLQLSSGVRLGVLGAGTAKSLKEQGYVADFAGNGDPSAVGEAFGVVAKGQRVLFPRAAQSRESVQKILQESVTIIDLVVYHNVPRANIELPVADILVFTSPLNVQAYFARYEWSPHQKWLAIGRSTAKALQDRGLTEVITAVTPSEEVLAELCKMQLNR